MTKFKVCGMVLGIFLLVGFLALNAGSAVFTITEIETAKKDTRVLHLDSDLITNGTMEDDANWTSINTPTTQERSSTEVYNGDYSRKFTVDEQHEGIASGIFSVVAGESYEVEAWVYSPDDCVYINIKEGDGSGDIISWDVYGLTADVWNLVILTYVEETTGSSAKIRFLSCTGNSSGTWYVDDVTVRKITKITGAF